MSNFSNLITTTKGHQFIFDILAGKVATSPQSPFTRIVTSSAVYQMNQLEGLVTLDEIRQETLISSVSKQNQTTIEIHGKIDNSTLTAGYRLNTLGVYFRNPDDGLEHLFGAAIHQPTPEIPTGDFIFPFNGLTTTTLSFDLFATVGNADNISLNVDPASIVTAKTLELHNTDPTAHQDLRQAIAAATTPPTMTQAQAEAGTSTAIQSVTAQRLRQASNAAIAAIPAMTQAQAEAGTSTAIQSVTAQRLRQAANAAITASSTAAAGGPMPRFVHTTTPFDLNSQTALTAGFHAINFQPNATNVLNLPSDFGDPVYFGAALETVRGRNLSNAIVGYAGYQILTKTAIRADRVAQLTEPMRWFRVFSSLDDIGPWQRLDNANTTGTTGTTGIWHGTSGTAAGTAAKVVTLSAGQPPFVRELGTIVIIHFTTANTAATPTMNVAQTGAANIRHAGINMGGILWRTNQDVIFSWDGTGWAIINPVIQGAMMASGTTLPGTPWIGVSPAATASSNQIADAGWVRARIAEAMDVVETGTFIPNLGGTFTVTTQYAYYTKVGRAVHVVAQHSINITEPDQTPWSSNLQLFGLPFQPMVGPGNLVLGTVLIGHWTASPTLISNIPTGIRNILIGSNSEVTISESSNPESRTPAPSINFSEISSGSVSPSLGIGFSFNFTYLTN